MFEVEYRQAKEHKDSHKSCVGEPYKDGSKLFELVNNLQSKRILEIGTAVGYTLFILKKASPNSFIDTIEFHEEHIVIAKENLKKWHEQENLENITFHQGDAEDILNQLVLENKEFDLIFFDAYGPKLNFAKNFLKLLSPNGTLISANTHLKSAEAAYFEELNSEPTIEQVEEFSDTKVYIRR